MSAQQMPQNQPVRSWDDMGTAGPFLWARSATKAGQWNVYVHIDQVVPESDGGHGHLYASASGIAADDGFGNLVLIGSLS